MKYAFHLLLLASLILAPDLSAQLSNRFSPWIVRRAWSPLGGDAEVIPRSAFIDPSTGAIDPDAGVAGPFAIGFPVDFDGRVYSEIYLSVDGWASFGAPLIVEGSGVDLRDPSSLFSRHRPNLLLAPYFGDHYLRAAGIDLNDPHGRPYRPGSIRFARLRSAIRDTLVVEWRDLNVNHLFDPADTANPNAPRRTSHAASLASFQLRIIEGDSSCRTTLHNASIEFRYTTVAGAEINPYGAAIGIESEPYIDGGPTTFLNGVAFAESRRLDSAARSRRLSSIYPPIGTNGESLGFISNAFAERISRPKIFGSPPLRCIDPARPDEYVDTICVRDEDFACAGLDEELTLSVLSPPGFTVSPARIAAGAGNICHPLEIRAPGVNDTGKVRVIIKAVDRSGAMDSIGYELTVSEPLPFSMPLQVRNTRAEGEGYSSQTLVLGMARNATSGEESQIIGRLDSSYCEYELPPLPPRAIFDARWIVPTRTGMLRNIQPENPSAGEPGIEWKATFQPGMNEDDVPHYPIIICWSISDAQKAFYRIDVTDPLHGAIFRVDMKSPTISGAQLPSDGSVVLRVNWDTACVEIHASSSLQAFHIAVNTREGVDDPATASAGYTLSAATPSPFSSTTYISFFTPKRGRMKIELFDINGNAVRTLLDGTVEAGEHGVTWDGSGADGMPVPSGRYFCRLSAGEVHLVRSVVLLQ
jgi:hypothetical protein